MGPMKSERTLCRKRAWDRLRLRQRRGVAELSRQLPGWEQFVDLSRVDVLDHHCCVLGQLPGGYDENLRRLAGTEDPRKMHRFAWAHGLDVNPKDADEHPEVDPYELLTAMWRGEGGR